MGEFHFLRPWWLLALAPLAVLVWRLARGQTGAGAWARLVDAHLLAHVLAPARSLRLPVALLCAGWLVAVLALAGPTWSRLPAVRFVAPLPPLVVVLDLSASMDAVDVPPSRLTLARARLLDLLDRLPPRPVALIVFAGSAHLALPATDDPRVVAHLLGQLRTDLPAVQGSRAAAGLELGIDAVRRGKGGDVLVVADEAGPDTAAPIKRLVAAGATVSVLAVGTATGTLARGGETVPVPLDVHGLREIALVGEGAYLDWRDDPAGLVEVLSVRRADLSANDERANRIVWQDRGPWLALVLLPLAALAFRRGWLGVVVLLWLGQAEPARAIEWDDLWQRREQRAQALLDKGEAARAAALSQDDFRRGVAHYRAGDYAAAAEAFFGLDDADAAYNRGNALAQVGRLPEARAAYERALSLRPGHADARFNLGLVEQAIGSSGEPRGANKPAPFRDERGPPQNVEKPEGQAAKEAASMPGAERQSASDRGVAPVPDAPSGGRPGEGQGDGEQKGGGGGGEGQARDGSKSAGASSAPSGGQQGEEAQGERSGKTTAHERPAEPGAESSGKTNAPRPIAEAGVDAPGNAPPRQGSGQGEGTTGIAGQQAGADGDDQVLAQWLERVPDESAGLLKELFKRQHDRQRYPAVEAKPW